MALRVKDGSYYRHVKSRGVYQVVCRATIEKDETAAVVYRSAKDDTVWVRPREEFCDGRFERLGTTRQLDAALAEIGLSF